MQAIQHRRNVLPLKDVLPHGPCHAGLEAQIDARLLVFIIAAQDVPGLGLAVVAVQNLFGKALVGMHLDRQALARVDQLDQESGLCAERTQVRLPEERQRIARDHVRQIRLALHADDAAEPLDDLLPAGIAGARRARRPVLREHAVFPLTAMPAVQRRAAAVGAPYARLACLEQYICNIHRCYPVCSALYIPVIFSAKKEFPAGFPRFLNDIHNFAS